MRSSFLAIQMFLTLVVAFIASLREATAEDFFLTIGGGSSPSSNQASLERNIAYYQRILRDQQLDHLPHAIFFADGSDAGKDLQVIDRDAVPKANRLMAEFFGDLDDLGLCYRDHQLNDVRGSTRPENLRKWFETEGRQMQSGDRLIVYVTAHGYQSSSSGDPYDTRITTWGNTSLRMKEFVELLDGLDEGVEVIAIMVQCHAGGFARFIFHDGDPDKGLSSQRRIGFFATVHDRSAAGCTAEIDEANYVEYSSYFWAAIAGRDRVGQAVTEADYDGDGTVSFDEAHAYTILAANTIDLPIKTSDAYLLVHSQFGEGDSGLLSEDEPYEEVLALATPLQQCVLEQLSEQLDLQGSDRLANARRLSRERRSRTRGRRPPSAEQRLRSKISSDLKRRWPELANVLNPLATELLTSRSEAFIEAVEGHPDYPRYRQLTDQAPSAPDDQKQRVKYDRFLLVAGSVILAENLRQLNDEAKVQEYEALRRAEQGQLK